nr:MAG TPA: hypothetical protein [Caudoviricetes sp.]
MPHTALTFRGYSATSGAFNSLRQRLICRLLKNLIDLNVLGNHGGNKSMKNTLKIRKKMKKMKRKTKNEYLYC